LAKVKQICEEKICPIIEELGYEVVEVEYVKKSDGMNLTFYIDNDKGIELADCEKVSKAIDQILEDVNPTEDQPYILNVSSPGLDRPLKTERDFQRHIGKEIEIILFAKINGKKDFKGQLVSYNDEVVTILKNDEELSFERQKIAHIVPVIKF
jgi:ribosome maturation factor RimP